MTAEIDQRLATLARQLELAAQRGELVIGVERAGAREPRQELRRSHGYFDGITVPQRLQVRAATLP